MTESREQQSFDFDFDERRLAGRTILVAGGTGGLGSATVALLAQEGASLVVGYRGHQERAEALQAFLTNRYGKKSFSLVKGDITAPQVRSNYVGTADALGNGLYAMVCFTGDPARVKFAEASDSDLETSLRENYTAPILLARESAAAMSRQEISGAIVLVSSMQAVSVFKSSLNYAGPKVALAHAARILAKDWGGPGGIRVNVVAPGVNRAGMALASIESGKYDCFIEEKLIPRFGRPEDVARVVRLLLEPDNYLTGQVITVDGGLTL